MATLRDIKQRINGVKGTQKITRAMKMVAASRLRRAQENMMRSRPYARKIAEVLSDLMLITKDLHLPHFEQREKIEKVAFIVITADRGLCGSFNVNIIKAVEEEIENNYSEYLENGNLSLYLIGKKGVEYFSKRDIKIEGAYPGIFSDLKFDFAVRFITDVTNRYINGEFDKVILVSNEFKSVIQQNLVVRQILPILPIESSGEKKENLDYIYEPGKEEIIKSLIPRYLNVQIWRALLESYAAELGARMTAMDQATENAGEMIRELQITYNKARQASITKEIIEIVSGANALKEE
jgi:F-type H+-transporting ATPase subunit gamma